jgi:hypothetical protein
MFRELDEMEEKEFRKCVYEDEKFDDVIKYLSLCHPVSVDEFINRIREEVVKKWK